MIYLETERLILRDYQEDDFNEYYRLKTDSKTMYYLQDIQLVTKEEAYKDFHEVLANRQKLTESIILCILKCGLIKEAEHIDYEWHDGKMKTRLEYRLLKKEWEQQNFVQQINTPHTAAYLL